jgi:hypothetical protein
MFSPNALKHYFLLPSVTTEHTSHLNITLPSTVVIRFPSITTTVTSSGLDYFSATVVQPPHPTPSPTLIHPPIVN